MESAELLRLVRLLAKKQAEKFWGNVVIHMADGKFTLVNVNETVKLAELDEKARVRDG